MDLLKRHRRENAEPAAPATDPPPPPDAGPRPDADPQGPAAWDRLPDAGYGGPQGRETARTPVTAVREPTDPRGSDTVEHGRRTWSRRDADGDGRPDTRERDRDGVPDRFEHARDEHGAGRRDHDRHRRRGGGRGRKGAGVVDEVVIRSWSIADAVTTAIGGALAAAGGVALARAEVDSTWYEPVAQVAGADHTPLLAAAELAVGVLIVLVGVARGRILSTLFGAALAVGGAVLAVQADEVRTELAVEPWWAWLLCGAGVLTALMALVPRKGRIERVERPGEPAPVA